MKADNQSDERGAERPVKPTPDPWDTIERAYRSRDEAKAEADADADADDPGARGDQQPSSKRPTDGPL
jgi:hypothetical protein